MSLEIKSLRESSARILDRVQKDLNVLPMAIKLGNIGFNQYAESYTICKNLELYKTTKLQKYYNVKIIKVQATPKKKYCWEHHDLPLTTPALVEAFERNVLTRVNYGSLKTGGMIAVEKYTETPEGVKNCYSTIKVNDRNDFIVVDKREDIENIVAFKRKQFQDERRAYDAVLNSNRVSYPDTISEEFSSVQVLAHAATIGGGDELNNLQMIFKED